VLPQLPEVVVVEVLTGPCQTSMKSVFHVSLQQQQYQLLVRPLTKPLQSPPWPHEVTRKTCSIVKGCAVVKGQHWSAW
jgi:hypothetical protein